MSPDQRRAVVKDLMMEVRKLINIWITLCLPVMSGSKQASTVRMLVRDQVQVLHAGQTLELSCEFYMEGFDLFDNPIIWKKVQRNEEKNINIMGNIQQPFVGTGRFTVIFVQSPPRYKLLLSIADLSLEDYGNYTCEVRAPQTTVIGSLTHYIFVRSPVRSISITKGNRSITDTDIQRTLEFTEGEYTSLRCVSYGGCPPPEMTLYLGKHEITNQFSLDYTSELSGVIGLRLIEHTTIRWSDRFRVTSDHDNVRLQCIVTVPGLGSNISTVKIRVRYAPIVRCDTKHAYIGDKNVFLRCEVKARPRIGAMFWIIDDNGTTVSPGQIRHEYWIINMDISNSGVTETRLYLKEARPESFRSYTLVAENVVATTTHQVKLTRKYRTSTSYRSEVKVNGLDAAHRETKSTYYRVTSSAPTITSSPTSFYFIIFMVFPCLTSLRC